MLDDHELLQRYLHNGSAEAFATLVERHLGLVYAAARRQVGDAHEAEDLTQVVFILLAQKAGTTRQGALLRAWLLKITHYAAANARKLAARRRIHEREAQAMQPQITLPPDVEWEKFSPLVDGALARLGEVDRAVLIGHCIAQESLTEVAQKLGLSEAAARKKLQRSLAKLRTWLAPHLGETALGAGVLPGVLVSMGPSGVVGMGGEGVPSGLAASVAGSALGMAHGGTMSSSVGVLVKGVTNMLRWVKVKTIALAGVGLVVAGLGAGTLIHHASALPPTKAPEKALTETTSQPNVVISPSPTTNPTVNPAELAKILNALEARDTALSNIVVKSKTQVVYETFDPGTEEWDGQIIGHPLEIKELVLTRLGNSYKTKITDYDPVTGKQNSEVTDTFDAVNGINRGLVMNSQETRPQARIDTVDDALLQFHPYFQIVGSQRLVGSGALIALHEWILSFKDHVTSITPEANTGLVILELELPGGGGGGKPSIHHKFWLDPAHNYLITRAALGMTWIEPNGLPHTIINHYACTGVMEVAGLALPRTVKLWMTSPDHNLTASTRRFLFIAALISAERNGVTTEDLRLDFPTNAVLYDATKK